MTRQELRDFRARVGGCELAVFADLATNTVLSSDGVLQYPQEYLDALCGVATQVFEAQPGIEARPVDHVLLVTPTGGRAFVRDADEPNEVLCCILAPEADCSQFVSEAVSAVQRRSRSR